MDELWPNNSTYKVGFGRGATPEPAHSIRKLHWSDNDNDTSLQHHLQASLFSSFSYTLEAYNISVTTKMLLVSLL